ESGNCAFGAERSVVDNLGDFVFGFDSNKLASLLDEQRDDQDRVIDGTLPSPKRQQGKKKKTPISTIKGIAKSFSKSPSVASDVAVQSKLVSISKSKSGTVESHDASMKGGNKMSTLSHLLTRKADRSSKKKKTLQQETIANLLEQVTLLKQQQAAMQPQREPSEQTRTPPEALAHDTATNQQPAEIDEIKVSMHKEMKELSEDVSPTNQQEDQLRQKTEVNDQVSTAFVATEIVYSAATGDQESIETKAIMQKDMKEVSEGDSPTKHLEEPLQQKRELSENMGMPPEAFAPDATPNRHLTETNHPTKQTRQQKQMGTKQKEIAGLRKGISATKKQDEQVKSYKEKPYAIQQQEIQQVKSCGSGSLGLSLQNSRGEEQSQKKRKFLSYVARKPKATETSSSRNLDQKAKSSRVSNKKLNIRHDKARDEVIELIDNVKVLVAQLNRAANLKDQENCNGKGSLAGGSLDEGSLAEGSIDEGSIDTLAQMESNGRMAWLSGDWSMADTVPDMVQYEFPEEKCSAEEAMLNGRFALLDDDWSMDETVPDD
ncbi:hypothetical protein ACHAWF_013625, partial [Thalassiosira exigua]